MRLVLLSSQRMRIIVTEGLYYTLYSTNIFVESTFLDVFFKKEGNEQIFGFCGLLIFVGIIKIFPV